MPCRGLFFFMGEGLNLTPNFHFLKSVNVSSTNESCPDDSKLLLGKKPSEMGLKIRNTECQQKEKIQDLQI